MPRPLILFAHGAGAPSSHPWMKGWAARLGELGEVVTFDYPYMREGRKTPDRQAKLEEAHRAALAEARRGRRAPVVLAGKSMGSRIGCHVALVEPVDALVCLGYPLVARGAGANGVRSEVLLALRTPILFVQGSRDGLCPLDLLQETRARMQTKHELYVVEGGNHGLELPARELARRGETQEDVDRRVMDRVRQFVTGVLSAQ